MVHPTVPTAWRRRVPQGVVLAFSDVPKVERAWIGPVPVTAVRRTLVDCGAAGVAPDLLQQAVEQAAGRGLVPGAELAGIRRPGRVVTLGTEVGAVKRGR
jgi:hypothetical protein